MQAQPNTGSLAVAIDGWVGGASGLRVVVKSNVEHALTGLVEVEGAICSRTCGNPVGRVELAWQPDQTVHLTAVELAEAWQRQGFSRGFVEHLALALPALGCRALSLMAMGAGGYAWAAIGFELDAQARPVGRSLAEETRRLVLAREHQLVLLEAQAPDGRALGAELRRATGLEPEAVATVEGVRELARFGVDRGWVDRGLPTWFGRELLVGAQWFGRRELVKGAR